MNKEENIYLVYVCVPLRVKNNMQEQSKIYSNFRRNLLNLKKVNLL